MFYITIKYTRAVQEVGYFFSQSEEASSLVGGTVQ